MRKCFFILMILPLPLIGQLNFTPIAGLNSTRLSESYSGYAKGGNFGVYGVEVEKTFNFTEYSPVSISLLSGVSYLRNGFNQENSFSVFNAYYYKKTNIETTYWQVPLMVRINWRPFPLVEDWRLFFGAGVSYNSLTHAHIAEQATNVSIVLLYYPPPSTSYQDSRDVTDIAVKHTLFERFDIGMKFKHLQVSWCLSVSMQDMYFKCLENNWQVPFNYSFYLDAHKSRSITKEKYSEVVFGWRF
ncbi:MAG: outer membrane beta-barrel protein [Bacteroidetes bacterium]|nr:outer membrane beta-barrel protein [Bacteroidota bacterium]